MSNRRRTRPQPSRRMRTVSTPDDAGVWAVSDRWAEQSPWFSEFLDRLFAVVDAEQVGPSAGATAQHPVAVMLSSHLLAGRMMSEREALREDRTCDKCRRYIPEGTPRAVCFFVVVGLCEQCALSEGWQRLD